MKGTRRVFSRRCKVATTSLVLCFSLLLSACDNVLPVPGDDYTYSLRDEIAKAQEKFKDNLGQVADGNTTPEKELSNRQSAVAYALKYADGDMIDKKTNGKENPEYLFYKNNCTNFVSQALYAGGMSMDEEWWYDFQRASSVYKKRVNSSAWGVASDLIKYLNETLGFGVSYIPRGGDMATVLDSVRPGDVIGGALYDVVNHADIVTKIDNNSIFYSGNSNPRKDEPLKRLLEDSDVYIVHVRYPDEN